MQINISTRHGQLGSDSQEKIRSKLQKLERFHDRVAALEATVDLSNEQAPAVEIRVSVEGAPVFIAKTVASQLMAALDSGIQKVEQQLRKHKEKVIGSHRNSTKRTTQGGDAAAEAVEPERFDDDEE